MILINSSPKDTLKILQPFSRVEVPMGLGYLMAVAESMGINCKFIDEQIENDVIGKIERYVIGMQPPYIFGFSVLTATFLSALILSRRLKKLYPDSIICFGGVHPTAVPEEILSFRHIDIVVRGEGELVLPELYRCIKEKKDFSYIDGLSYRENGQLIHNKDASIIEDLDLLPPFPYHRFSDKHYGMGFIMSSRGCPYRCIFCSNRLTTRKKYRYRSEETIIDELDLLYNKYHKRNINFVDDNFIFNKKRLYTLIELIKQKGFHKEMNFRFQARGDSVDYELLTDLYNVGFRFIFLGLETASEKIMKSIKKGETVAENIEAVRIAKEIGFHVSATFIYGLPGETHKDRMDCLRLSKELKLDMVRYNNATPYPGTELYEIAKKENRLTIQGIYQNFSSVSAFIEKPFNKIPFSYVPIGSSEKEIRNDIIFSYLSFYLNINKIKMMMFSRNNAVKRWFNPGEKSGDIIKKIPALLFLGLNLLVKFVVLFVSILTKNNTSITSNECIDLFCRRTKAKKISSILSCL